MSELTWRPIETAPTDQRIFLWCSDERWSDDRGCRIPTGLVFGTVRTYQSLPPKPQGEGMSGDWTFTHWMPLPAEPNACEAATPASNDPG